MIVEIFDYAFRGLLAFVVFAVVVIGATILVSSNKKDSELLDD